MRPRPPSVDVHERGAIWARIARISMAVPSVRIALCVYTHVKYEKAARRRHNAEPVDCPNL